MSREYLFLRKTIGYVSNMMYGLSLFMSVMGFRLPLNNLKDQFS